MNYLPGSFHREAHSIYRKRPGKVASIRQTAWIWRGSLVWLGGVAERDAADPDARGPVAIAVSEPEWLRCASVPKDQRRELPQTAAPGQPLVRGQWGFVEDGLDARL